MNALRLLVGVFAIVMVSGARAEEKKEDKKDNAKLILGTWEVVKADTNTVGVGSVIEFAKDGKAKITHKKDGDEKTAEATYVVDGATLTTTMKTGEAEVKQLHTIEKLTATELVVTGDKDTKTVELKRKK